jgi:GAF domain-containing protein
VRLSDQLLGYVARTGLAISVRPPPPCARRRRAGAAHGAERDLGGGAARQVPDAGKDPRYRDDVLDAQLGFKVAQLVCVPVPAAVHAGRVDGVMLLANKASGGTFTEEDLAFAKVLARQLGKLHGNTHGATAHQMQLAKLRTIQSLHQAQPAQRSGSSEPGSDD